MQFENAIAEESLPVLTRLRRNEAISLMKAHDIAIPVFERDGRVIAPTKEQLMGILESHMGMGTFQKKPKYPEQLLPPGQRTKVAAEFHVKNRGPNGGRWCIMYKEEKKPRVKDYTTEAEAVKAMEDGVHLSTGSQ